MLRGARTTRAASRVPVLHYAATAKTAPVAAAATEGRVAADLANRRGAQARAEAMQARAQAAAKAEGTQMALVTKDHDTPRAMARRLRVGLPALLRANGRANGPVLKATSRLRKGWSLRIPPRGGGAGAGAARRVRGAASAASTASTAEGAGEGAAEAVVVAEEEAEEEAGEEEEGAEDLEAAQARCAVAASFLLRVRQNCEYNPAAYHELIQVAGYHPPCTAHPPWLDTTPMHTH